MIKIVGEAGLCLRGLCSMGGFRPTPVKGGFVLGGVVSWGRVMSGHRRLYSTVISQLHES